MELNARDLARLLELNKKKAELEFQARILNQKPDGELRRVSALAGEFEDKAKSAGVRLIYPNQERLDCYAKELEAFPADAIREGLKVKDGRAYQTLKERGMIIKKNYENRAEIAKLLILIARMGKDEGDALANAIASGGISAPLRASTLDEGSRAKLARFLRRCGIMCALSGEELSPAGGDGEGEKEIRIEMPSRCVWVSEDSRKPLEENLKKMNDLNARIQLKNAERQIKVFTEEEETLFASLQKDYLDLLKEQDELLREFNKEEGLSVKCS
jgi:hypothetical protein